MYKFTNGIVVFDEKTRDAYIKSGMRLEKPKLKITEKVDASVSEIESNSDYIKEEVTDENCSNDEIIKEKFRRSNKKTKQI